MPYIAHDRLAAQRKKARQFVPAGLNSYELFQRSTPGFDCARPAEIAQVVQGRRRSEPSAGLQSESHTAASAIAPKIRRSGSSRARPRFAFSLTIRRLPPPIPFDKSRHPLET